MTIRRGDDTDAFGFGFLTVNLDNAGQYTISKAEIRVGTITRIYTNPVFPIRISLNRAETERLKEENSCYMALYDTMGKKKTCKGKLVFQTEPKVV